MKVPEPNATITITFQEFSNICADVGVEMTQAVRKTYGNGMGDQISSLTSLYAAEIVKHLFKNAETAELEDTGADNLV